MRNDTGSAEPWRGRRVLITGADGFIGSHITEALVREGASVRAFCYYNSNGHRGWLEESDSEVKDAIDFVLGDVRDSRSVESACADIDVVLHLAALIAIPYSYRATESYVDTNVKGTLNVLEAARRANCARIVHTSTSEVYGTPRSVPIIESHQMRGQSPYSATKIGADMLVEAFHASYGLPVVILRPFNTYGPRQSTRAIIPTILSQLIARKAEVALGSLTPKRDFTFVSDTVTGFLAAGTIPGIDGETIQLGTGSAFSIEELFDAARRVCGSDAKPAISQQRIRPEASEVQVLLSDPTKAKDLLGWQYQVSLEEGLAKTATWVADHMHLFDVDRFHV